jgi:RHS repeat-associated protein
VPSGLVSYLCRFYDLNLQRWLNRDPLGEPGFEVLRSGPADVLGDGPNLYGYVKNRPVDLTDPLGLDGEATLVAEPTLLMDEEALAAYRAWKCRCAAYAAAVQAAKKAVGALGGCQSGDTCAVLAAKNSAWLTLAIARSRLNKVCFGGGNAGHQQAQADAWANVGKCGNLLVSKGCAKW